ncbi:MAG: hypothetical protein NVS4B2_05390 [Chloroflexota bacterium]
MATDGLPVIVDSLVTYDRVADTIVPPSDMLDARDYRGASLAQWWVEQMLKTSRPLQEKMTLFWHGHFATGISKVGSQQLMYRQNQLFRTMALGRFDDLLSAVYKDPAMLKWLDGQRNTKQAPNENWGREVLELFVLGHGNYTEDDVHACSRIFTGWRIGADSQAQFVPRLFDSGTKTLLGQTGDWTGEDGVRILANHPATGPFLATKLWRFFASDRPPASAIKKLAKIYYTNDHVIGDMVRALFLTPEFYAPATRYGHVKSPVDFVLTTVRQLGIQNPDVAGIPNLLTYLGQQLFNPPNVGGWPGGTTWINASTMLGRFNFASAISGDIVKNRGLIDASAILEAADVARMGDLVFLVADMLGIKFSTRTAQALLHYAGTERVDHADVDTKLRGIIHLALISPEFQVS